MNTYTPSTSYAVIDIETAPLPEELINPWLPPLNWEPWNDTLFNPDTVKLGNLKDPVKINRKIDEALTKAKQEHEALREEEEAKVAQVIEEAALHPYTGWVFGIGVALGEAGKNPETVYSKATLELSDEPAILEHVWEIVGNTRVLINHNLLGFDLLFLVARSLVNGVRVPFSIDKLTPWSGQKLYLRGHQNPVTLIDTMQVGAKYGWRGSKVKMNTLARFLGVQQKLDLEDKLPWDVAREDFCKVVAYMEEDARIARDIGKRMQLI